MTRKEFIKRQMPLFPLRPIDAHWHTDEPEREQCIACNPITEVGGAPWRSSVKATRCDQCGHAEYLHDGDGCTALDAESTRFCGCSR